MKKRFSFFIIIFVPLAFLSVGLYYVNRQHIVTIDSWGVATDDAQLTLEGVLLDVQRQFAPQVTLTMHYVADITKDGTLHSFQTTRLDGIETTPELRAFDLEENQRRLMLQKFFPEQFLEYVRLQSSGRFRVTWEEIVRSLGIKPEKVTSLVKEKGEALLREESERLSAFKDITTNELTVMPLVLINGKRYEGSLDFYSISAAIAKEFLRGKKDALGERGGVVRGIRECYADLHCNDKSTMDGVCENAGTETARCAYATPLAIHVLILTPEKYVATADAGRAALARQFKGLTVAEQSRVSVEGQDIEQRIEQALFGTAKLKKGEEKKELPENIPLYVFSPSLEQSPSMQKFIESGTVLSVKDVGYLVNPFPIETASSGR